MASRMTKNYTNGQEREYFNLRGQQERLTPELQIGICKKMFEKGRTNGRFVTVDFHLSCTLESPRKLLKIPKPRPHLRSTEVESVGLA